MLWTSCCSYQSHYSIYRQVFSYQPLFFTLLKLIWLKKPFHGTRNHNSPVLSPFPWCKNYRFLPLGPVSIRCGCFGFFCTGSTHDLNFTVLIARLHLLALPHSFIVNVKSLLILERSAKMMERNASWHWQQLSKGKSTVLYFWKEGVIVPPPFWFWLVAEREVTLTSLAVFQKLDYLKNICL